VTLPGEKGVREWLRNHASPGAVVLAPDIEASWLLTVPVHAFASHDDFSFTFDEQGRESRAFYSGEWSSEKAGEFLERYGIRWVSMPAASPARSYFAGRLPEAAFGDRVLYGVPNSHTRAYPGKAASLSAVPGPLLRFLLFVRSLVA
jgi:hypothetical protein